MKIPSPSFCSANLIMTLYFVFRGACGMGYGFIYERFYNGGDALMLFRASNMLKEAFYRDFRDGWHILFYPLYAETKAVRVFFDFYEMQPPIELIRHLNNFVVIQLLLPLNILSGGSFYLTNFYCGFLAGLSAWASFRYFDRYYAHQTWLWAFIFLFLPVSCFWASGISKETLLFSLMCWVVILFHQCIHAFFGIRKRDIFLFIVAMLIIGSVRIYLAAGLVMMFVLWGAAERLYRTNRQTWFLRLSGISILVTSLFLIVISQTRSLHPSYIWAEIHYNREEPVTRPKVADRPKTHFKLVEDQSVWSTLKAIPAAISVAFFRPFPQELKGQPLMVYTASADGMITICMTGIFFFYRRQKEPQLLPEDVFFLFFALIYGAFLGLSVGNWGTLFRYKVYVVPFLLACGGIYRKKSESCQPG